MRRCSGNLIRLIVAVLFSVCIQFLVERAESYRLLFDLLHDPLPLVTCNSTFCFLKLIAESI